MALAETHQERGISEIPAAENGRGGLDVFKAVGVEAEQELPVAALDELVQGDPLGVHQREALAAVQAGDAELAALDNAGGPRNASLPPFFGGGVQLQCSSCP